MVINRSLDVSWFPCSLLWKVAEAERTVQVFFNLANTMRRGHRNERKCVFDGFFVGFEKSRSTAVIIFAVGM